MRAELWLLLAACGAPAATEHDEAPPAAVTCQVIAARDVDDVVELTGVIAPPPTRDAVLSAPIAGRVAQVVVEEGDRVAAGALIAAVDDPTLPAGRRESEAQLVAARAVRDAAEVEVVRQRKLLERGISARRELDDATTKAAAAAAELTSAEARVGLATQQLARRELRAPFAGVVLHVWRRAGEHVDGTAATPIAEVADISALEVRAQVAPRTLLALHEGLAARVEVLGLPAIPAAVTRVAPAVDAATLLGTVRLALHGAPALPVGSPASAHVVTAQHRGLVVPAAAVRRSDTGSDELVVCAGNAAHVRAVTIGQRSGATVEVVHGLAAGEAIVVDHALGLADGQPLTQAAPASAHAPEAAP